MSEVPGKKGGPPTLLRGLCRRCRIETGDLRRFCGVYVGGTGQERETSDTFAGFLSEVPVRNGGPPTLLRGFCRRCRKETGDLRRFCGVYVGGTGQERGTSDAFAGFLSEVPGKKGGPPTLLRGFCRRSAGGSFGNCARGDLPGPQ